jgi:hypothetical protein
LNRVAGGNLLGYDRKVMPTIPAVPDATATTSRERETAILSSELIAPGHAVLIAMREPKIANLHRPITKCSTVVARLKASRKWDRPTGSRDRLFAH